MTFFSLLQRLQWLSVAGLGSTVGFALFSVSAAWAQIVPDDTLGAESSVVIPGEIDGAAGKLIEGGATRDGKAKIIQFCQGENCG